MGKKNKALDYLNYALSFGLTLVITAYILYLGGSWLDKRLGTDPFFMILGVLLAIVTVFRQMINELLNMEKEKKENTLEENPIPENIELELDKVRTNQPEEKQEDEQENKPEDGQEEEQEDKQDDKHEDIQENKQEEKQKNKIEEQKAKQKKDKKEKHRKTKK